MRKRSSLGTRLHCFTQSCPPEHWPRRPGVGLREPAQPASDRMSAGLVATPRALKHAANFNEGSRRTQLPHLFRQHPQRPVEVHAAVDTAD